MTKRVVWKAELHPGLHTYELPAGAAILSCGLQRGQMCIWFLCDPAQPKHPRHLLFTGTGHEFPDAPDYVHIGTAMTEDQNFVFHVFEALSEAQAIVRAVMG